MFSEFSRHNANIVDVAAMRDGYVFSPNLPTVVRRGELVFSLNYLEIERDQNNLKRQLALLELTKTRLESKYVDEFVMTPLRSVSKWATEYYLACSDIYVEATRAANTGTSPATDIMEAQAQYIESGAFVGRSELAVSEKAIEIEGQRRRMRAESTDLQNRLSIVNRLVEIHSYKAQQDCSIEWQTYDGAFVEAGDTVCLLHL